MIPLKLIPFCHGEVAIQSGTRNAALEPSAQMVFGMRVSPDGTEVTLVVPDHLAGNMLDDLADNGRIAVTFGAQPSHEAYQVKGTYLSSRSATADDLAVAREWIEGQVASARRLGAPHAEAFRMLVIEPASAVVFRVEEIYGQTPGPGAGDPLAAAQEGKR